MPRRWVSGGICTILMVCGGSAMAEDVKPLVVQKVTFRGAKHLKESELRTLVGVDPGMPFDPNRNLQGCQKIMAKYEEMGRSFACCKLIKGGDPSDTEVIYQITEGPKVIVRDIQFTGNTFVSGARLTAQIKSSAKWFPLIGNSYNKQQIESNVGELSNYYRRAGYRDVRVSPEIKRSVDGREVTVIFHIQEGKRYRVKSEDNVGSHTVPTEQLIELSSFKPDESYDEPMKVTAIPFHIGKIRVCGNKQTSTESILAHVPLAPGQTVYWPQVKAAEKILTDLDLFVVDAAAGIRPVITTEYCEDSGRSDLIIHVVEKPIEECNRVKAP
jgi:outer membrane protein assembly factor BamA